MECPKDLQSWLNHFSCPAFSVNENTIVACNQAAEGLLILPGADVRQLLLTGRELWETHPEGCLYLKLNLSPEGYGAAVTRQGDGFLFLLEQDPEDAALRSLALAARELRNPLSNLMIASDKLTQLSQEAPSSQEWLARLKRSLNQIHRLVNNMSDASRQDILANAGFHEWNRLIHDMFERIQTQLVHTNVCVSFEGLPEPVYGYCKEAQLERAILNVVSNAMKFMPEGGQIHARLTRHGSMLHLSITDTGSGIAATVLDSIFCRYQRQPAIEDSRYGLGLGLVLIRNAAANHGGTVLIDSPDGKGTRVTITLAIRQEASAFKEPIQTFLSDDTRGILRELSDCLPWEAYQND